MWCRREGGCGGVWGSVQVVAWQGNARTPREHPSAWKSDWVVANSKAANHAALRAIERRTHPSRPTLHRPLTRPHAPKGLVITPYIRYRRGTQPLSIALKPLSVTR